MLHLWRGRRRAAGRKELLAEPSQDTVRNSTRKLNQKNEQATMILNKGEKIHVVHRRHFEKDVHRHFVGVVEEYEAGVARATGNVFTVDQTKYTYVRRPEKRTRLIAVSSGELLINILPPSVDLDKIVYHQEKKSVRVTDGSDWHLDLSEFTWT